MCESLMTYYPISTISAVFSWGVLVPSPLSLYHGERVADIPCSMLHSATQTGSNNISHQQKNSSGKLSALAVFRFPIIS